MKKIFHFLVVLIGFSFVTNFSVFAQNLNIQDNSEKILNFHQDIIVNTNSTIQVTDKITVFATGEKIKRGIYKFFPTVVNTDYGKEIRPIKILEVTKDGVAEPYFTELASNGFYLYIGVENVFLQVPQNYTYEIKYLAYDQIRSINSTNELFWNVTGNYWDFPIDKSSATITLPFVLDKTQLNTISYIGEQGSTNQGIPPNIEITSQSTKLSFLNTTQLNPGQGFSIVIGWPKGFVYVQSELIQLAKTYASIFQLISAFVVFVFASLCIYLIWKKYGKDRGGLPSIPVNFEPPKDLSPLEVRFIDKMGQSDETYVSLILLKLAINGYIKLVEYKDNEYAVVQTTKPFADLTDIEQTLYNKMFSEPLPQNYNPEQSIADLKIQKSFLEKVSSIFETPKEIPGAFKLNYQNRDALLSIRKAVDDKLKVFKKNYIISNLGIINKFLLLLILFIGLYFIIQACLYVLIYGSVATDNFFAFVSFDHVNLFGVIFFIILFVEMNIVSLHMPRRTNLAREYQDKIEGFKIFLKSQEYYLKGLSNDIPSRFNMYEKYLPFAIALDLEPIWSEKFKNDISQFIALNKETYSNWYVPSDTSTNNAFGNFSTSAFTSSVSSTMRSITVSSSRNSGFGGGSGGSGGSGGGGGGW